MGKVSITESYLTDISNAIRGYLNTSDKYFPSQMAPAIRSIPRGMFSTGIAVVTQNGNADTVQDGLIIQLSTLLTWNNTATVLS